MQLRKAVVDGQFYPGTADELKKSIEQSFRHKLGPGMSGAGGGKTVLGIISPHAGYTFSGPSAAHGFRAIKESDFDPCNSENDLFIIIGFSHSGLDREASTISADWETPLGVAEVDKQFVELLISESAGMIVENPMSLNSEHSIEVQLPFLQFIYNNNDSSKERRKKFRFVPISVSHNCDFRKLADIIKSVVKKTGKRVCYIASSDFTHYGYSFGFVPFSDNIKENLKKLDMGAIEFINKLDSDGFLAYLRKTGATICGSSPIALLLELIKEEAKNGELLNYYTSGDLTGDYSHCVSYASIVFKEK